MKPMTNPPIAAPVMLPIPPRTAAVNAFRPALKPRLNWIAPKYRPGDHAAAPASADPMKNVIAIVRLMSTPISCAASRSWAVDRIACPSRVRQTNSCSATISTSATTIMKMFRHADAAAEDGRRITPVGKIWGSR